MNSLDNLLNLDDNVMVRGVPVKRWEVEQIAQAIGMGATLYDTSVMSAFEKNDCANTITLLDKTVALIRLQKQDPLWVPEFLDTHDGNFYVPVTFSGIDSIPSKRLPAGFIGWYRVRRQH